MIVACELYPFAKIATITRNRRIVLMGQGLEIGLLMILTSPHPKKKKKIPPITMAYITPTFKYQILI